LVRLSAPELVSQRAQAEAALGAAESQLSSAEAKLKSDEGTRARLEAASKTPGVVAENDVMVATQTAAAGRGSVAAAESQVKAARDALRSVSQMESYLNVTAPFSGVVSRRNLHPGALVGPASGQSGAQPILQIVDTDRLRLVVPVPEADVGAMALGTPVRFVVPAYLGETFSAPIARVSHDVNVQTRTMHVELDVENQNGRLSPGSFATVTWPIERGYPTSFVPTSAVASDQQRTFVIRAVGDTAEWVTVQTGQTLKGEIEVVGNLQAGDRVVKNATDSIRNGQKITPAQP
jgi:membrane fusion protein, multidrug efflux system